ncbi:ABC transporter permease, partial [Bacteroidota bacterium]
MRRYLHDIIIAVEAIFTNRLKSILTALGIIFGVAAVISMLAIGKGAQQEILEQMKQVGVNNIIISAVIKSEKEQFQENLGNGNNRQKKFSPGLTLQDSYSILDVVPTVGRISPEIIFDYPVISQGKYSEAKLMGVIDDYFPIYNIALQNGKMFTEEHLENGLPVCIVNRSVQLKIFNNANPIGKYVKCGNNWLKIIGVIEDRSYNFPSPLPTEFDAIPLMVYVPIKTALLRFQNRALITEQMVKASNRQNFEFSTSEASNRSSLEERKNNHQLDRITVQVKEAEQLVPTQQLLFRMFNRRHNEVGDFDITIPELLLKQQQRTKDIFNIVLGAIASISLVVGGIGIMNIMFASVMERIKE